MDNILEPVILTGFTPKADGSITLRFNTMELDGSKVSNIHSLRNQHGVLYFKAADQLTSEEMETLNNSDLEYEGVSKSKRQMNDLYVLWKRSGSDLDQKDFYAQWMDKIHKGLLDKINEYDD